MTGDRCSVDYAGTRRGPCLAVIAALHGDETSGVDALVRVRRWLDETHPPMRGRLVGVLGNLPALAAGVRYIDSDLNRNWYEDNVAALSSRDPARDSAEDREARELVAFLDSLDDEPNRPVILLDLHSTSADGLPFLCMPDTLANLRIALEIPVPSILGLEETIRGPLLGLMSDRGYRGVIVEGGRHDRERTTDVLESCVWLLVVAMGMLTQDEVPDFGEHWNRLAGLCEGLPRVLEVTHRHDTSGGDGFAMLPGFEHYQRVRRGQLLARDDAGEIRTPRSGRIIMPAYKPGTDQGYFIARDVPPLYVWTLFLLRRLNLHRVCHLLPGARRMPGDGNFIEVASWVPDWMVNIIRLLGWRRTYRDADRTVLRRRYVRK
jgi:succinylglutamate desuccinylase